MIRVLSLFTGIGAFEKALKNRNIPYDLVAFSEIDKHAVESYCAIHNTPNSKNLGDVCNIHGGDLTNINMITYGFPCFTADTLILTDSGYKKIIDVKVGDYVLTHNNVYKEVTEVHNNGVHELMRVKVACVDDLQCTPDHKFYCRERSWKWDVDAGMETRRFTTPEWKCAKDFTKDTYIGYAINQNSIVPEWEGVDIVKWKTVKHQQTLDMNDPQLWYLVGRYLGDGWLRVRKDRGEGNTPSSVYICCGKHKVEDFISKIHPDLHYTVDADRTVDKFIFSNKELALFMSKFGHHADGKHIPGFVMDMPVNLLKELIQGYLDSDGYLTDTGVLKISSINRTLLYGVGQLITKVYHCPISMYRTHRKPTCVIEGRVVNQKDSYTITFKPNDTVNGRINFYENGYVWYSVRGTETIDPDTVYDLTVEDDHSFTANGLIVHNCTDIALCGKQQGLINADGNMTRSGLFFEALRIIDEVKPQFAVCENIAALAKTAKWSGEFKIVLDSLTEIGYRNYYAVLNAKDYGIPQHRERVFIVSVRDDVDHGFVFPKGDGESGCIADILEPEENVDAKHYLKPSRLEKLIWYNPPKEWNGIITNGSLETGHQRDRVYGINGVSATLTATDHKQPKQIDVRQIAKLDSHRDNPNQYRVYDAEGLSPTLTTMGGGGRQPHIPANGGVRRFTPLECFRLMGFDDEDYQKCVEAGVSDTQLYRQAGNSICVNVLEAIFDELFTQYPREFV